MLLKKKLVFLILIILIFSITPSLSAQTPATSIETLRVAFWPDYDEPSVLVLITGSLPADTELPAEVTIPIPENAEINAVARINSEVGMADTQFEIVGDRLVLVTPDPQFRVEYYVPYSEDGDFRSFDFNWESELDVGGLAAEIQQPSSAVTLLSDPPAQNSVTNPTDGLIYHGIAEQSVPAGTLYELDFRYNVSDPALTAGQRTPVPAAPILTPDEPVSPTNSNIWIYLLGGLLLLVVVGALTWVATTRFAADSNSGRRGRKSQKPVKPRPRTRNNSSAVKYCHQCGTAAERGDRFCRSCGTELK